MNSDVYPPTCSICGNQCKEFATLTEAFDPGIVGSPLSYLFDKHGPGTFCKACQKEAQDYLLDRPANYPQTINHLNDCNQATHPKVGHVYKHWRTGEHYRVLCIAVSTEDGEKGSPRRFVAYQPLGGQTVWLRSLEQFCGKVEVNRFEEVRETVKEEGS